MAVPAFYQTEQNALKRLAASQLVNTYKDDFK